jgi:hypothetical protein
MSEEAKVDSKESTNGRVYLDDVVANTREAAKPRRKRGVVLLLVPALVAGAALVAYRRAKTKPA